MPPPDPPPSGHDVITPSGPEETAFVRGLVERGEAAERDAEGQLPPGATHEIVGRTEAGVAIVRRVRFSSRPY